MALDRLQRLRDQLQRRFVEPGHIAGCQWLVARRGEVLVRESMGLMDVERLRPMRDDALFRIYSMTKPITSVALMMLWEEGRFGLDDPVQQHIPQWRGHRVWVWRSATHCRPWPPGPTSSAAIDHPALRAGLHHPAR